MLAFVWFPPGVIRGEADDEAVCLLKRDLGELSNGGGKISSPRVRGANQALLAVCKTNPQPVFAVRTRLLLPFCTSSKTGEGGMPSKLFEV